MGLERVLCKGSRRRDYKVSIPHGGLRTEAFKVLMELKARLSPSHPVGSEPFKVRLFVEAAKRSPSHTVGLERGWETGSQIANLQSEVTIPHGGLGTSFTHHFPSMSTSGHHPTRWAQNKYSFTEVAKSFPEAILSPSHAVGLEHGIVHLQHILVEHAGRHPTRWA